VRFGEQAGVDEIAGPALPIECAVIGTGFGDEDRLIGMLSQPRGDDRSGGAAAQDQGVDRGG